jgi:predicted transcriptional regulator
MTHGDAMKKFNFVIPDELKARVDAESDRTGASLGEIARRALNEYLERREPVTKERPRELVQAVR